MSDTSRPPTAHPGSSWSSDRETWAARGRWFAAEFLVVVSGVLVALLINAWWAGRQDAAREARALERLYEEAQATVVYLGRNIAQREALIRSHEAAVAALAAGAVVVPDLEAFREGLFFAFTYPSISPPRSVYDEVTGAGLFGALSAVEVRSAISKYYGSLDGLQNLLPFFRQTAQPGLEMTMEYPFAYDSTSDRKMQILVEPALLRGDRRVLNQLIFGLRNQIAFQSQRQAVYRDAVAMCEVLASAVHEQCDAAHAAGAGSSVR